MLEDFVKQSIQLEVSVEVSSWPSLLSFLHIKNVAIRKRPVR